MQQTYLRTTVTTCKTTDYYRTHSLEDKVTENIFKLPAISDVRVRSTSSNFDDINKSKVDDQPLWSQMRPDLTVSSY